MRAAAVHARALRRRRQPRSPLASPYVAHSEPQRSPGVAPHPTDAALAGVELLVDVADEAVVDVMAVVKIGFDTRRAVFGHALRRPEAVRDAEVQQTVVRVDGARSETRGEHAHAALARSGEAGAGAGEYGVAIIQLPESRR